MKKKDDAEIFGKLVKLTKLIKDEKIKVEPAPPGRGPSKWRSKDPKFSPKTEKRADLVEGGGMQVDDSRKQEYDQWRQDKIAEQNDHRDMARRRAEAKRNAAEAAKRKESGT